jgi:hypothetical protein
MTCFFSNYYDFNNHYLPGNIVINLLSNKITFDGVNWQEIEEDHL